MPHGKPDFSGIDGPVLGHFGTADEFIPQEDADKLESELKDAGVDVTFHYYEGAGHAFFNDTNRLGTYDAGARTDLLGAHGRASCARRSAPERRAARATVQPACRD